MLCPYCGKEGYSEEKEYSEDKGAKMGALDSIMHKLPEMEGKEPKGPGMIAIEIVTAEPKEKKKKA